MKESHSTPEQRRAIRIIESKRGYHTTIADNEYAIAGFKGQTGLLIPLPTYRSVGRETIIGILKNRLGDSMEDGDILDNMEQKNAFVLYSLPRLYKMNESTGNFELNQETQDRINNVIHDIEEAYEQKEHNRFN